MKKRYEYSNKRDLDGLTWATKTVDFGVSLTVVSALNELMTSYSMLRERKDLFRHRFKRLVNESISLATNLRSSMLAVMKHRRFFDAYSDRVIDLAETDITMFRISIKQTLDDSGCVDSDIISYVETARTLLEVASEHYKSVMKAGIEDYGVDYSKFFMEFNARDVFDRYQKACDILYSSYGDINLNTERTTLLFEKMARKFAEGEYVQECLRGAVNEFPEFTNEIEVKDNEKE